MATTVVTLESDLIVFGEHARELISSTLGVSWIERLAQTQPPYNLVIIPIANEMRNDVIDGDECIRKNSNGIDLNRNAKLAFFDKAGRYSQFSEEFAGITPLSEAEPKFIDKLAEHLPIRYFINVHSGEFAMYCSPDGSKTETFATQGEHIQRLKKLANVYCKECVVGSAAKKSNYLAHGTNADNLFFNRHVAAAFTFEVYGTMIDSDGCYKAFNPLSNKRLLYEIDRWINILNAIIYNTF
tara:strand:- start:168 stop:890 length:723 start_codon:yes stop_codon:yes gene_type:complete